MEASIKIEAYNSQWPAFFEAERDRILEKVGKWVIRIEHVGSTAVPGLPAKPTIDMCVIVDSIVVAHEYLLPLMQNLGYEYIQRFEDQIPDRRYFQRLNNKGEHLFHAHVVEAGGPRCDDYLLFRDYLIAHPDEARYYSILKCDLSKKFANDREAYTTSKAKFIRDIITRAAR